ncbi:MAG TPA: hypothetical protein ACFYD3_06370 [Candidatus Hypogeohydataceae bacterium YC41]
MYGYFHIYNSYFRSLIKNFFFVEKPLNETIIKESKNNYLKLRLVRKGSMAYWGDRLLPVRGKHFDMLCKLASHPGEILIHQELHCIIESEYHKDLLLRQYINYLRKTFPPPYCDPHHPEGIIKTRKMEGYYLDLPPDRVEII